MKKIKYEKIFNISSVIFILFIGVYFIGRFIYYGNESKKEIKQSNILYEYIINSINKYEINSNLVYVNNEYVYTGNSSNNYIKYNGLLWRIIKINSDNSITMITEDTISTLSYNKLLEYLNTSDNTYSGIFNKSIKEEFLTNTKICINKIKDTANAGCFESNKDFKIGILSLKDYIDVGANKSYLNNSTDFWLSNGYDDDKYWYVSDEGMVAYDDISNKHGIRPVLTISNNIKFYKGNGTFDNPFELEKRKIKTTSDLYIGEYIKYNDEIWKIVNTTNNIKIVNTDKLQINGEYLKTNYSNSNNEVNNNNKVIKYLNSTYYKTLPNKEYLVKDKFYTGSYSLRTNNYQSCYKNYITNYVGMLSIGELFYNEISDVLTMTPSNTDDLSIFSVNSNNQPFENTIDNKNFIRISIYLKNNIEITSGTGNIDDPYILGDVK